MRLQLAADTTVADWISGSDLPFDQLVNFGPVGFEAYARLRFIPDPTSPGQSEADVELPEDHPSDLEQARRAVFRLAGHTTTADRCFFCVWDGYSDTHLPPDPGRRASVDLRHRSYTLLEGPLEALQTWEVDVGDGHPVMPPAYVWPADRSWCFARDVDPHWAGIGASREAIRTLLEDPVLDVVSADPSRPQPNYY